MDASLYVHVPFCSRAKCDYCDFYSIPVGPDDKRPQGFVETLLAEAGRLFETYTPENVPSLYIGGGTPSALGPAGIRRLAGGLLELIARYSSPPTEVTIEANPETADEAFLSAAREGGATRLSLGIQSFHAPSRRAVNRVDADTLLSERLRLAAEYFPGAFSGDLISGLPLQNERILKDDIAALLSCKPAHVSFYALTVEEGTPFYKIMQNGGAALPQESDRLWLLGRDTLEEAGYHQYEVSNFCLPGKESVHNIRYWRMQNWLALGPAASGTVISDEAGTGFRYTIPPDVDEWLRAGGCEFSRNGGLAPVTELLDTRTLIKETLLMGFRYIDGPDEELFCRRFHQSINDLIPKTLSARRAFLQKDKLTLTKEGLQFLNPFLVDAFQEIDETFSLC